MPEINVEVDLNSVNEQITRLVDELNKVNNARDNLIQQVQNLNGVAMYLRGKMPNQEGTEGVGATAPVTPNESFERSAEYPEENTSST